MNHTPTPWTYDRFNGRIFRSTLDAPIANCATEANGNHIVHCVNTHAALVEALKVYQRIHDLLSEWIEDGRFTVGDGADAIPEEQFNEVVNLLADERVNALTLAEKGAPLS